MEFNWTLFIQYLIIGLANGALIALIALGYTLVYGIVELINFAHGEVFMMGAFFALTVVGCVRRDAGLSAGRRSSASCSLGAIRRRWSSARRINFSIDRVAYRRLAQRAAAGATDRGHRIQLHPAEHRHLLEGLEHVLAARPDPDRSTAPIQHSRPNGSASTPRFGSGRSIWRSFVLDDSAPARLVLVRLSHAHRQGDARHRPGPRRRGADGHRYQSHDRHRLPPRRRAGRRGRHDRALLQQHAPASRWDSATGCLPSPRRCSAASAT